MPIPSRRLDDRIRQLSDQLGDASNDELTVLLPKLLSAIHEKLDRLRNMAGSQFLGGKLPAERRLMR